MHKKVTVFNNSLIWFGAAVSIAEIMTGALIAPLGFAKGMAANILGHVAGGILFYLASLAGAKNDRTGMECAAFSFGKKGGSFFSVLNILQLLGWTSVMIIGGAQAASVTAHALGIPSNVALWAIIIGALIIVWLVVGVENLGIVNIIAMTLLFGVTVLLSVVVFRHGGFFGSSALSSDGVLSPVDSLSFGSAVELSAAMPLSWLPLAADYTRNAEKPRTCAAAGTIVYTVVSVWMYAIGLGAALFTGESSPALIMVAAGFGIASAIIVILSTVTTTFLDVYSAGVSWSLIKAQPNKKIFSLLICVVGVCLAIFTPIEQYQNFLYLIGSIFAPMAAVIISDVFIIKRKNIYASFDIRNACIWLFGFILYRIFLHIDTPIGNTIPVFIIVISISALVHIIVIGKEKKTNKLLKEKNDTTI